jgi:hypothetical protein
LSYHAKFKKPSLKAIPRIFKALVLSNIMPQRVKNTLGLAGKIVIKNIPGDFYEGKLVKDVDIYGIAQKLYESGIEINPSYQYNMENEVTLTGCSLASEEFELELRNHTYTKKSGGQLRLTIPPIDSNWGWFPDFTNEPYKTIEKSGVRYSLKFNESCKRSGEIAGTLSNILKEFYKTNA